LIVQEKALVTIEKAEKPKIYTESDQMLDNLKDELAGLKTRMNLIEEEQEENRNLLEQLSFHENLSNELMSSQQEEIEFNKENYQVIANVMQSLKSPVSNVVDNLAGIISEIDDKETQDTLRICMDTASNVLNSFDEVEDFCLDIGSDIDISVQPVNLRSYLKDILENLSNNNHVRLLIDKDIPLNCPLSKETIALSVKNLLSELQNSTHQGSTILSVSIETNEQKYGIEISDLIIKIKSEQPGNISWKGNWVESIQNSQHHLMQSGFSLLKTREMIRKAGGHIDVLRQDEHIQGFKILFPLTY